MQIVVISDIHANLYALEAVLKDISCRGVDEIYCTGDLVGYIPFPNEIIDLIRKNQIQTVMGNYDDGVGNMRLICGCDYPNAEAQALGEKSIVWTKEHTSEENKDFLRQLPQEVRLQIGAYNILIVHGSPRRLNEYLKEDTKEEYLMEVLNEARADILICGHTHRPYHKSLGDKHVINAGSVGKPKHGNPNALYLLINIEEKVSVQFIEVAYDVEATATAIEKSELPNEFAQLIREGRG